MICNGYPACQEEHERYIKNAQDNGKICPHYGIHQRLMSCIGRFNTERCYITGRDGIVCREIPNGWLFVYNKETQ